ncbi:hypothetical protein C1646_684702 [Rhizophagus diaphanus]|nr:hypothetical protein C1646_684702 [Rhizophagus diaphanus] [Rhizophagus sp. MUCL 43196]
MAKIKILLDKTEPSKRLHVLALDSETHCYLNVKISFAEELVNRNYKDILNAFMIFRIDFCDAFNEAKSNEKFRKKLGSFKNTSFLWKISPKDVTDVYEQVFTEFKKLKPKKLSFITCYPQESKSRELNFENSEVTYNQVNQVNLRNNIFLPETENPVIMQDQDYLSDNINCSTSQSQYDEPELDNSETLLDIDNSNTNDLNSTIQFGNTEVSDNIYNLSGESNYLIPQGPEFDNFETTLDQFNINMISETNQFDSSEVTNIDYNIPQLQYLSCDNAAYNMAYNLGMSFCELNDISKLLFT